MTAVPKQKLTPTEYLALERDSHQKHEFLNGELFAMAGASRQHNDLKENLSGELHARLKGGPCRTSSADQRVKIDRTGLYTYPDLLIVCGPRLFAPEDPDTLLNPQVVFEILSDSTERYDRGLKFRHYQQLPSLREYVLVSQDQVLIERFVRQSDETWVLTTFADPAADFALATVSVQIPMADIYRGVELPKAPPH